jgi:hypothetical protein
MRALGLVLLWACVVAHLDTAVGQEQYCASGYQPGFAPKYCLAGVCRAQM